MENNKTYEQLQDDNRDLRVENDSLRYAISIGLSFIRDGHFGEEDHQAEIEAMMTAVLFDGMHAQEP